MARIPDRFLGFAFSVGDILIETDRDFNIKSIDGAASDIGLSKEFDEKICFLDLMNSNDQKDFLAITLPLKPANRIGPANFRIGKDKDSKRKFSLFINKLPEYPNRIFISLVSSYRLNRNNSRQQVTDTKSETENLLGKIENILTEYQGQDKNLNITLMETKDTENLKEQDLDNLNHLLKKYSTGGNTAGRLADNRFALVHEKEPDGMETKDLLRELTKSTGINLNSTTIDADDESLSEQDGIRALVYSLQQFADEHEDFNVDEIANNYDEIIENTSGKVQKLRTILKDQKFSLVYQPIIDLKTKETHHSEALIRFNDPELHDLQFETICFAEKVGLIHEFDKAIFMQTVEKLEKIIKDDPSIKLAVNMSGKSLSKNVFLQDLLKQLQKYSHLKNHISLEITESSEITNLEQLSEFIDEIRSMGFRVYLDDFGAGAAGFQYLRDLEIDGVKIDGQYVRDALSDKKMRAFLKAIVTLCNDLDIVTIGEWVETSEQEELLQNLNVTYAQGYYYGQPNTGIKQG
ncbi:EAL domain-containing protein [Pseudemcibacter aquimaris]|uniref:EAL domain-containing protein n=1 Tax=Pseudemcibacter aquimaris TaxID=2857064 RepID=UPI002011AE16|nr:EAL domain-containing protein [Pseudemcibacter aquimaris]MCC3860952.1 EAL domain-containing protein [Pseudemcibacter aquimaris]WDU59770.1 EAL domain-containing protein [Pseudemcibacter aquimaris]